MGLARKEAGYPVEEAQAAQAVVTTPEAGQTVPPPDNAKAAAPRTVKESGTQPSAKDRSIVRQVAWKIAGPAMANWTGTPDAWFEKCVELRAKIEQDILNA